jgi:diguanylate cyclase (GGDEF)-like protein/PAS domain S-box-containing protein
MRLVLSRAPSDGLPPRELLSYRLLGAVGAGLILAFTFVNRLSNPGVVDPLPERLVVGSIVLGVVVVSFFYRRPAYRYLIYGALHLTTLWVVHLLYLNHFSVDFALSVLVLVSAFSLVYRTRVQLVAYELATLAVTLVVMRAVEDPVVHPVAFTSYMLMICLLSYIVLGARLRTEAALRSSEERFRTLIENSSDVITILDREGVILYESPSVTRVLGYEPEQLVGSRVWEMVHPDDLPAVEAAFAEAVRDPKQVLSMLLRFRHADGSWHTVESTGQSLLDHPYVRGVVINSRDVTERRVIEDRLLHNALHDALTGLPNRFLFMERLDHACRRAQREAHPFAVLFLDLDRFKLVNDSFGHRVGDELLVAVARAIQGCLRPGDTAARIGGDEFAILLEDVPAAEDAERVAQRLRDAVSVPRSLSDHEVYTSASIGMVLSSQSDHDSEALLQNADLAMYHAKAAGRARYETFDRTMHEEAVERLQMETDLRHALARGELHLNYQPIVSLESGRIVGFEALARWSRSTGPVPPSAFIPLAEETGLILPIGDWVLREAVRQLRQWQLRFPSTPPITVSINLSGRQFSQPELVERIADVLAASGVSPESLCVEITESVIMENAESAVGMLARLRELGTRVHLDDFGTGYSSLGHLHRLPLDTLKIDRSFVGSLESSHRDAFLMRSIVELARNLEIDVVVEGVETAGQLAALRELRCGYAQGFLFSRPLEPEGVETLLAEHTWPLLRHRASA